MSRTSLHQWCNREVARYNLGWLGSHVDLDGEQVHYVEAGTGEPLVLIHGFMAWSFTWRRNLEALAEHAHVLALDLRGFGLSAKDAKRKHSLFDQVEVLRAFLDAKGIGRSVLCGHSMGGEVAVRFALTYPDRVKALVLVSSSGYVYREKSPLERLALWLPSVGELFVRATVLNRRFAGRALRTAYRQSSAVTEADVEGYLLPARAPGAPGAFVCMVRDMDFGCTAQQIRNVTHRTLIIWGENDPWIPVQHGRKMAQDLKDSRLVVFADCGHVPPEEHPDEFNRVVSDFLQSLDE